MEKIKINRNSFISIKREKDKIDYHKWIDFINNHKNLFIWYEDTEQGKKVKERINEFSEWTKEAVLYKLNKSNVYCTKELSENHSDFILKYDMNNNKISVHLEKKITKKIAEVILNMAKYLGAIIIIDDKKEFKNIEQLE